MSMLSGPGQVPGAPSLSTTCSFIAPSARVHQRLQFGGEGAHRCVARHLDQVHAAACAGAEAFGHQVPRKRHHRRDADAGADQHRAAAQRGVDGELAARAQRLDGVADLHLVVQEGSTPRPRA